MTGGGSNGPDLPTLSNSQPPVRLRPPLPEPCALHRDPPRPRSNGVGGECRRCCPRGGEVPFGHGGGF
eukprot:254277-Prorocentrum_minimum.AAC.1